MKRTTIFLDEQLERELQALARKRGRPMAGLVREAVERYIVDARTTPGAARRGFVALGRSGRRDTAERHEELLWEDALPDAGAPQAARRPRPASRRGPSTARGTRRPRRR